MKFVTKTALAGTILAGGLTALPAQAAIITSYTNSTYGVFDGNSGNRSVTIAPGGGTLLDVNIAVEFSKCGVEVIGSSGSVCPDNGFSFNNEIVFQLTSPNGTIIDLVQEDTFSGQVPGAGRLTIIFDDEALDPIGGSAILAGSFIPVQSLSAFDGESAIGEWILTLEDTVTEDPLEFFSFTLTLTTVPEPITLSLFGAGLAGLAIVRRRRSVL